MQIGICLIFHLVIYPRFSGIHLYQFTKKKKKEIFLNLFGVLGANLH